MDDASSEDNDVHCGASYNPDDDVDIQDDDEAPATQPAATTGPPPNRMRSGSLRRQSPLAQVDSGNLTVADTEAVEVPGPGISCWRHYGIWVTFAPSSAHAVYQSADFPDYASNKAGGIQPLKQHFILADVQASLATEPRVSMFENRVIACALVPHARMALDKYIRVMEENTSGFWHGGHWFAIDTATQGGADMQRERKRQWDALARPGVPSTIFWEVAYWSLSCYWILMNPRSLSSRGSPYSLAEQLDILDRREPAREQCGTATSDGELVEHIPKSVSGSLLLEKDRRDNPASRTYD
ncbi:hypothetical protein PHMEG_00025272 [Phytophthora megakarya]|uniref:Uncharacterized protein n=1 Tax=Phytophthora megakarya TaxID=4795 RepID=A0A225VCF7_9STRA|nr:hypothetical protein PHMEG_00025272 [Phytophthora megakarya]